VIEGDNVFVGTRTGSGKSLTYESFPVVKPNSIVLVIAPLVTIMSEQCKKLENFGFHTTFIGKDVSENDSIENGMYNFVFGSPEMLVADKKWREVLNFSVQYQKQVHHSM